VPQGNEEIILRLVEGFNRRDLDRLADDLAENFEFVPYLTRMESTTYRGRDAFRQYFEDAGLAWDSIQVQVEEIRDIGGRTLFFGEIRGRGRASSVDVHQPLAWIAEFSQDRISRLRTYSDRAEALEAAGVE
jgi:ketosteroid isomerase-like protein